MVKPAKASQQNENILPARFEQFINTLKNDLFPRYGVVLPLPAPDASPPLDPVYTSFHFAEALLKIAGHLKDLFILFDDELGLMKFKSWATAEDFDFENPVKIVTKFLGEKKFLMDLNQENYDDLFLYELFTLTRMLAIDLQEGVGFITKKFTNYYDDLNGIAKLPIRALVKMDVVIQTTQRVINYLQQWIETANLYQLEFNKKNKPFDEYDRVMQFFEDANITFTFIAEKMKEWSKELPQRCSDIEQVSEIYLKASLLDEELRKKLSDLHAGLEECNTDWKALLGHMVSVAENGASRRESFFKAIHLPKDFSLFVQMAGKPGMLDLAFASSHYVNSQVSYKDKVGLFLSEYDRIKNAVEQSVSKDHEFFLNTLLNAWAAKVNSPLYSLARSDEDVTAFILPEEDWSLEDQIESLTNIHADLQNALNEIPNTLEMANQLVNDWGMIEKDLENQVLPKEMPATLVNKLADKFFHEKSKGICQQHIEQLIVFGGKLQAHQTLCIEKASEIKKLIDEKQKELEETGLVERLEKMIQAQKNSLLEKQGIVAQSRLTPDELALINAYKASYNADKVTMLNLKNTLIDLEKKAIESDQNSEAVIVRLAEKKSHILIITENLKELKTPCKNIIDKIVDNSFVANGESKFEVFFNLIRLNEADRENWKTYLAKNEINKTNQEILLKRCHCAHDKLNEDIQTTTDTIESNRQVIDSKRSIFTAMEEKINKYEQAIQRNQQFEEACQDIIDAEAKLNEYNMKLSVAQAEEKEREKKRKQAKKQLQNELSVDLDAIKRKVVVLKNTKREVSNKISEAMKLQPGNKQYWHTKPEHILQANVKNMHAFAQGIQADLDKFKLKVKNMPVYEKEVTVINNYLSSLKDFSETNQKSINEYKNKQDEEINEENRALKKILSDLNQYLAKRHAYYRGRDFFLSFIATFTCGMFAPGRKKREYFVNTQLKDAITNLKKKRSDDAYQEVQNLLSLGKQQFKGRAKKGEKGYDQTMQSVLEEAENTLLTVKCRILN